MTSRRRLYRWSLVGLLGASALAACSSHHDALGQVHVADLHKIKHVIVVMQESRSFDQYFGTYPEPTASRCRAAGPACAFPAGPARRACARTPITPT